MRRNRSKSERTQNEHVVFGGAAARPPVCPYFSSVHLTRFPRPTPHSTLKFRVLPHLSAPPASHSPA